MPATRGRYIREARILRRHLSFPGAVERVFSSNNECQVSEKNNGRLNTEEASTASLTG